MSVADKERHEAAVLAAQIEQDRLDLWNAVNGLLGLVQLLSTNLEISPRLRAVMLQNHRYTDALALIERMPPP